MCTEKKYLHIDPAKLAARQFQLRITGRDLANAAHVAPGTVCGIRNGRCRCKVSTANAIASVLGVPLEEILKDN